jgi:NlpC/P60 family putative phage cell wall peptidase
MINRADIVSEAREWLGTRWQHQASLKGIGSDCIGLVAGVARNVGIVQADEFFNDAAVRGYGRQPDPRMLLTACAKYLEPIQVRDVDVADIYLMHPPQYSEPQHFALVSQMFPQPYIIHAYAQARKVVENRLDDVWRARVIGAYRFRGLD